MDREGNRRWSWLARRVWSMLIALLLILLLGYALFRQMSGPEYMLLG